MSGIMNYSRISAIVIVAAAISQPAAAGEEFSYVDLVNRMLDLEQLAVLPLDGERGAMQSSYDRASKYDEATGKYVEWAANRDGGQYIRKEGDNFVFAEMEGPGCIWRIWSALAKQGHVKIYLDGEQEPTIDMAFDHYFDGKHAPFDYPALAYTAARGRNLYLPIPYQKSCKIVAEPEWGAYFQFTYTEFPKGTKVPTFTRDLPADAIAALKRVDQFLGEKLGQDPSPPRRGQKTIKDTLVIPAGSAVRVARLAGPRAITALKIKMGFADREDEMAALRKLVLRATWDGQDEPAVWCPLGDFFGTAPGVNYYRSLPVGMTDDGFYSYWFMPFGSDAQIELVNEDVTERTVELELAHAPLSRPFDEYGYFHCKWHRDLQPVSEDRWPDWEILRTTGRGRFVGVMLHVWNPRGGWWGEGDEKFFVDGEKFPSTFGTGSEDYFGYAWCTPALFHRPYHNQTMTENNAGHQSVNRWQIIDNVPFHKSFDAYIEKYYPTNKPTLYACTAYWYLSPDGVDHLGPVPVNERHGYYVRPPIVAGGYQVIGKPRGTVRTQDMRYYGEGKWRNNDQLWWTDAKPADTLDLILPVQKEGRYRVRAALTRANDYGIVQLYLDDAEIGGPIDLYNPDVVPTGPLPLGVAELTAGDHKLTIKILGANDNAVKSYMFGLDRIILTPDR
ncbi:MAG: DUF2961 domain-containing protein [Phycisphaerales bacterium]|nr:MAG: DUF2961 domain-containing protein [Phycisphaerales bacterium]